MQKKNNIEYRLQIINIAKKIGISETGRIYNLNWKTVARWIKRYDSEGIAGLSNRSKKEKFHPNKMPEELEKKIIKYKSLNLSASASAIIRELDVNYSLPVVIKKIKDSGLWLSEIKLDFKKNTKKRCLFLTINKIETDISYYLLTALDSESGLYFHSFTKEYFEQPIYIFLKYLIYIYKKDNIEIKKTYIIPLKKQILSYFKKDRSVLYKLLKTQSINLASISDIEIENTNKVISNFFLDDISDIFAKNRGNIKKVLVQSSILLLEKNFAKLKSETTKNKFSTQIQPFLVDNYLQTDKNINKNILENNSTLLNATISFLLKKIESSTKNLKYLDITLHLIKDKKEYIRDKIFLLKHKIRQKINAGQNYEADELFNVIDKLSAKNNYQDLLLENKYDMAIYYLHLNNLNTALNILIKCYEIARKNFNFTVEMNSARIIALISQQLKINKKDLPSLENYLKKALLLGDNKITTEYYIALGIFYKNNQEYDKSENYLLNAEKIGNELNDNNLLSQVNHNFITFYSLISDEKKLYQYKEKQLEIVNKINDLTFKLKALHIIGFSEFTLKNYTIALKYFIKEYLLAEKFSVLFSKFSASINIAIHYEFLKKYKKSIKYFNISYNIIKNTEFDLEKCFTISKFAALLIKMKKFEEASNYLVTGVKLARKLKNNQYLKDFKELKSEINILF